MSTPYIVLLLLVALACAERWDKNNDPSYLDQELTYEFKKLPSKGSLDVFPWSDSYWPSYEGGIAFRWFATNKTERSFNYHLYSENGLAKLSFNELAALSPAEKFDIYHGRFDYPTVQSEWKRTSKEAPEWEGLCHGWAPAAIEYRQPRDVNITTKSGRVIPFGSADVKALLTYYVAEYMPSGQHSSSAMVGDRCNYDILGKDKRYLEAPMCRDTNAATFHIAVTNQIGLKKKSFVIDRDRSYEVWNQPIAMYNYTIVEEKPYSGSDNKVTKVVRVIMSLFYVAEIEGEWKPVDPELRQIDVDYNLELDKDGKIIGGSYNEYDRTDFLWSESFVSFFGYFSELNKIYSASIGEPVRPSNEVVVPFANAIMVPLENRDGTFGIWSYSKAEKKVWRIEPKGATKIGIKFNKFKTTRVWDTVRIFEGENGPLVAVLHGDSVANDIVVFSSSAYVVFSSRSNVQDGGFEAQYYSV
jgi:hypothetical protein